jgi:hypothetical protein
MWPPEPRGGHETAEIHHAGRRRGGGMATFRNRAAETASYRISQEHVSHRFSRLWGRSFENYRIEFLEDNGVRIRPL